MPSSALVAGQLRAAPKTYAEELGWETRTVEGAPTYTGHYRVRSLRYEGWITEVAPGKLVFYIRRPPLELLKKTKYAGCFHARQQNVWLIAFKPYDRPADISSGIAAIQKALDAAFDIRSPNGGEK